ncbi:MAG TPA: DNA polymerase I [Candidatus Kapabacteria bacterium]|nr:DNA polymerase I [Candidatus Kapabacteria bacterium]
MKKVYLIDAMSLVFRAYHAMGNTSLKNNDGMPTGAIFGFTNIITSLLEKEKPEYMAIIFDRSEPTFRHISYPPYKQNREAFPEDLSLQMPLIKELIDNLSIFQYEEAGFEADDIIGSIAKKIANDETLVYCVTSDKDYYQLVDTNIKVFKPGSKGEDFQIIDFKEVEEKFGVSPDKVIDVMGLIGDAVDNIPGVKGVGEKTAIPLIQRYGTMEYLYSNLNEIDKKSLFDKLSSNKDIAFLSKELVTIKTDMYLETTLDDLQLQKPKYDELDLFFQKVGINTLRLRWKEKAVKDNLGYNSTPLNIEDNIKNNKVGNKEYTLLSTIESIKQYLNNLDKSKYLAFDLETDSLDRNNCNIVGIALSNDEDTGVYIPVESGNNSQDSFDLFSQHTTKVWEISLELMEVLGLLKATLEDISIKKCGQNSKFDMYILKRFGISVNPIAFDTMVASYLINPDDKHNLDAISRKYLNYSPIPISSLIGDKKSEQKTMREIDPILICDYAAEDADLALKLSNVLSNILEENNLIRLATEIEFPIVSVLTQMEFDGVSIDSKALSDISINLSKQLNILSHDIYREAGEEFNIDSPKQLAEILFDKLQIVPLKKNKTGFSTDLQVLTELSSNYPFVKKILEYRHLGKLKSTYVDALPKLINKNTNRIHTTYNQTVAATGRLSSTDPNLQNIPIRTDAGKEIRKAFIAKNDNFKILSADYSQIELRIMAYMCKDVHMIESFKQGLDIHSATASNLYGLPIEEVNKDLRRIAKTVNFGIMYGLGSFGLAQRLEISRKDAKSIIDNYFDKYPGIKSYMEEAINFTKDNGYSETILKRRRYFPDIYSKNNNLRTAAERGAINMPIQGSASDMIKIAMINISNFLNQNNYQTKLIMQVHDELIFEVHNNELGILPNEIIKLMQSAIPLGEVPILVEYGIGNNWLEAH